MLKKCDLPLLVLISLLFSVGTVLTIQKIIDQVAHIINERSPMVQVCRNALANQESGFREEWSYLYTVFSSDRYQKDFLPDPPPISVVFGDGAVRPWCHMRHNGSGWQVDRTGVFYDDMMAPYP